LSGIRIHDPSVPAKEDFHALDRAAAVFGGVVKQTANKQVMRKKKV
jgi:hypothetical protein